MSARPDDVVIGGRRFRRVPLPQGVVIGGRIFRVPGGVRPRRRNPNLGALAGSTERGLNFPLPRGGDSSLWPYTEDQTWGVSGPPSAPGLPPPIGAPVMPLPQTQPGFLPTALPFGIQDPQSPLLWSNPTTFSGVPINAATPSQQPVLSLNFQRNALIVQNNSTATSPDTTPTFYIGFNTPVTAAGFGIALTAGQGIVFDTITPRDSIFILQVGGAGASLVVAGVIVQGTYAPAKTPPPQA